MCVSNKQRINQIAIGLSTATENSLKGSERTGKIPSVGHRLVARLILYMELLYKLDSSGIYSMMRGCKQTEQVKNI